MAAHRSRGRARSSGPLLSAIAIAVVAAGIACAVYLREHGAGTGAATARAARAAPTPSTLSPEPGAPVDSTVADAGPATRAPAPGAAPVVVAQSPRAQCGARVPFVTLEAESSSNATTGRVVRLTGLPGGTDHSPELEASGRGYVELAATGEYVEFPLMPAADAMVIRACIPDAPEGGGISATLGLYVNGQRRQDVELTSKHTWLYGQGKLGENGQSQTPTASAHVFWDEARLFVTGGIRAGDTVRLQKDATSSAAYYRIDLVEPELVPPPGARPAGALSIAEFGATGGDVAADTAAIEACIAAARAQKKTVWIPPGTYLHNARFDLDGVRVQGSGMWHTTLRVVPCDKPPRFGGHGGFAPSGTGAGVFDLCIDGPDTSRGSPHTMAFIGTGASWTIRNVWMTHLGVGLWIAGEDGTIAGCRVRLTYADGINVNNGKTFFARRILVEDNHVRGTGDDGIAILSHAQSPHLSEDVTVRHNTVACAWWGSDCDLAGGRGHVIEDNVFADSLQGGFSINLPGAYPMTPLTGAVVRRNELVRCGGNEFNQRRGAMWIYPGSTSIAGTVIEDNRIVEPIFRGIHLVASNSQEIVFRGNVIERPGQDAVVIERSVTGSGEFANNTVTGLAPGARAFVSEPGDAYRLTLSGNSWQRADEGGEAR